MPRQFYFTACVVFATFALFPLLERKARADVHQWVGCGGSMIWGEANYIAFDPHGVRWHGGVSLPNNGWMITSLECWCTGQGLNIHQTPTTQTANNGWTWTTDYYDLPNGDYVLAVKTTYISTGWPMAVCPVWGYVDWTIDDAQ